MGDTPTSPGIRLRRIALATLPGFPRSDVLACGRRSLVRYYAHTEQVSLNLNTYVGAGASTYDNLRHCRPLLDSGAISGYGVCF